MENSIGMTHLFQQPLLSLPPLALVPYMSPALFQDRRGEALAQCLSVDQ
jgi:hypothetical protein